MVQKLGQWRVESSYCLGKGGFSHVYDCFSQTNHPAVIKVFQDSHFVNTFEREVQMLSRMKGIGGTPDILDFGRREDGCLCIVTDKVSGLNLADYIDEFGVLSEEQTLSLLESMLAVLSAAHAQNIIHMDLKPTNVMVDEDGFHLIDWGVSRNNDGRFLEHIQSNQTYIAPERYYGVLGIEGDFYSLAWLVLYALTGGRPYHFDRVTDVDYKALAHCFERPRIPKSAPEELKPLLYNWLSKDQDKRLVAYDVDILLSEARGSLMDFVEYKTFYQLSYEFSYLHQASLHGIPYCKIQYYKWLFEQERVDEAMYWLNSAFDDGYLPAFYYLAKRTGRQKEQRYFRLISQAAASGSTRCRYLLGKHLLSKKKRTEAFDALRQSASEGHLKSQKILAIELAKIAGMEADAETFRLMADERTVAS